MSFESCKVKGLIEENIDEDTIVLDGFDDCIISIVESFEGNRLVYSRELIFKKLVEESDMTIEEASEFYYYNILGTHYGDKSPIFDFRFY